MRLAVKLPLLLVATVSSAAVVGGLLTTRVAAQLLEKQARQANIHSVHAYASAVATHLDDASLTLEATAGEEEIAEHLTAGDPGSTLRLAEAILERSEVFEHLILLHPDGSVALAQTASGRVAVPGSLAYTAWYRTVRQTGDTAVSELHVSDITRRPSVVIATPVLDGAGALAGIWAGALRLDAFSRFGQVGEAGDPSSYGVITDGRGLVIAHQANPDFVRYQTDFSSVPAVRAALDGRRGSGRWLNPLDGGEKLGAYLPIPSSTWTAVYATRVPDALAPVGRLTHTIVGIVLAVVLFLGGFGAALGRRLTRPLRRLAHAATRIAAGHLDQRVDAAGGGEVGDLADRFNAMMTALAIKDAELRTHARQLEQAYEELESFTYSVSHDLRAPLRGIDGFSNILLEDYDAVLDDEGRDHLARVRAATQRMGRLIDDLLGLSRVGRVELRREAVDLSALAGRIAGELRGADPDRDTRFVITPGLVADADPALAEVALRNLLGNAWKFTARTPGAAIEFGQSEPGRFFVRDNGAGFDMTYAGKLFGAFQRLHPDAEFEGNGVGLATVARVVRRHGGWIRGEGEVGRGATFTFALSGDLPPPVPSGPPAAGAIPVLATT